MAEKYYDDEMLIDVPLSDETDADDGGGGKILTTFFNKNDAPLTEANFTVLMKLIGSKETRTRPGLDLVLVLDVSGSMNNQNRIQHLKNATKFLIKKLSHMDRLSIVKFSRDAQRLCPLRQMNANAQAEIAEQIFQLRASGNTNMTKALEVAMKVVNERKFTKGREVAIMFMSDGEPNPTQEDGRQVDVKDVPVYTFGLGRDCDHQVLNDIAKRSKSATFSTADVGNDESSNLSVAFSQCLAGLLSIVVQDLTLTIKQKPPNSTILEVSAGDYKQMKNESDGSVTISFGNLYRSETRNVLVDLVLPQVKDSNGADILEYTYSYKYIDPVTKSEEDFKALSFFVTVDRSIYASAKENSEVSLEKARLDTVDKMKTAMEQANKKDYDGAKSTVKDAQDKLKNNGDVDVTNAAINALESELSQFIKLLEPGTYEKLGRTFVMAALLSHALQRFASKGNPNEQRMFATDAMNLILDQVNEFVKNPNNFEVPSSIDDTQKLINDAKEASKQAAIEEAARKARAEEEVARQGAIEEAARQAAIEEAAKQAWVEEEADRKARTEEEAARQVVVEKAVRQAAIQEADRRTRAKEEGDRKAAAQEAARQAAEEASRQAIVEAIARQVLSEEDARQAAIKATAEEAARQTIIEAVVEEATKQALAKEVRVEEAARQAAEKEAAMQAIAKVLTQHLGDAIKALTAIQDIINQSK